MEVQKKRGTVVFLKANEGSKSEGLLPRLYEGKDKPLLSLFLRNDNPFENKGLHPYDGVRVEVTGIIGSNGDLTVHEIKAI